MKSEVVKDEIVIENGLNYRVLTYSNGSKNKMVVTSKQEKEKYQEISALKKWLADRKDTDLTNYPDVQAEKAIKNARLLELLG